MNLSEPAQPGSSRSGEDNDYGPVPESSTIRNNLYFRDGDNILAAATLTGQGKAMKMAGVTWYGRDRNHMIVTQIRAPRARFADPGWQLEDPVRFDVQSAQQTAIADLVVAPELLPAQISMSKVDADAQDVFTLRRSIADLEEAGRPTRELQSKWWHKFTGPLSAALMPLLGAVAAFGLARSGHLFVRAVIGMGLGFAFFVVDNAALAMGNFGAYPPFLAATAPFALFLLVGETVLIRTEE